MALPNQGDPPPWGTELRNYILALEARLAALHVRAEKTGDQGQASASLANVAGLGMAVGVGTHDFEIFLPYTGDTSASSPITLNLTGPAASFVSYAIYIQVGVTGKTEVTRTALNSSYTGGNVGAAGTPYAAWIKGRVTTTTSGTLQPQFAGDGTHVVTIKSGAFTSLKSVT